MAKKIAAYVRVSSYTQRLVSQEDAIQEYADNHGLTVKWYKDQIQGNTTKRPALDMLHKHIFAGKIGTVIIFKLDRLSRKGVREGLNVLANWLSRGVRLISIQEQFDFEGALGELLASIFLSIARMERDHISQRVKAGMHSAMKRGVKVGKAGWKTPAFKFSYAEARALRANGIPVGDIALQFNVTKQAIYLATRDKQP